MDIDKWSEVEKYLGETKRDCLELKEKGDLSCEGNGMLAQIDAIEKILGRNFNEN
jgi:hypothetical protein